MSGPLLGAHVSTAGGHHKCFERAAELGCEALQIFTRAPGRWQGPALTAGGIQQFHEQRAHYGSLPVIAHDIYLSNLAAADEVIRQRSIQSMLTELDRCQALGIDGLVCHMGSHSNEEEGLNRYSQAISEILSKTEGCPILLETTAGQGTCLGHRLEHLAHVIQANQGHPRLGVCLDTCHVFAAGYDLREPAAYEAFWSEFETVVGLDRLKALHLNDSKKPLASRVDRHAHIGQGEIGANAFRLLVNDSRLKGLPMLLETAEADGMHRVNLDLLKSYRT
ncbi:MAG: deoxyribonuclease IV [Vulcanimicrobiota bacterium]